MIGRIVNFELQRILPQRVHLLQATTDYRTHWGKKCPSTVEKGTGYGFCSPMQEVTSGGRAVRQSRALGSVRLAFLLKHKP